jgi:hypothetical protein
VTDDELSGVVEDTELLEVLGVAVLLGADEGTWLVEDAIVKDANNDELVRDDDGVIP